MTTGMFISAVIVLFAMLVEIFGGDILKFSAFKGIVGLAVWALAILAVVNFAVSK